MSLNMTPSLHGSTAFNGKKIERKGKKSTIKEVKQSEQILPAKVRTILHRRAQVLSHHQTTNIKYRPTATDSEPFSLWNTVIRAQHSAQLSFVKATRFDIMFRQKWTKQVQLLNWENLHFSEMCFFLIWRLFNWIFDTFLKNKRSWIEGGFMLRQSDVPLNSVFWLFLLKSCCSMPPGVRIIQTSLLLQRHVTTYLKPVPSSV